MKKDKSPKQINLKGDKSNSSISEDFSNFENSADLNLVKTNAANDNDKLTISKLDTSSGDKNKDKIGNTSQPLTKSESNKTVESNNSPSKTILNKSPAKSDLKSENKSGSEIQSEYENTFESLGDVLRGSRDIFNEPVHLNKSEYDLNRKDSNLSSENKLDTINNNNSDIKITQSSENPFGQNILSLSIDKNENNQKNSKHLSR